VHHSTLGLRVIKKKKKLGFRVRSSAAAPFAKCAVNPSSSCQRGRYFTLSVRLTAERRGNPREGSASQGQNLAFTVLFVPCSPRSQSARSTRQAPEGVGFRVQGSGFRVQGSRFRVQGLGFRVQGSGFRVQGSGFRVQGSGFRVQGLPSRMRGCRELGAPDVTPRARSLLAASSFGV